MTIKYVYGLGVKTSEEGAVAVVCGDDDEQTIIDDLVVSTVFVSRE
jgi:hypothetical protein